MRFGSRQFVLASMVQRGRLCADSVFKETLDKRCLRAVSRGTLRHCRRAASCTRKSFERLQSSRSDSGTDGAKPCRMLALSP